jgi:hypothetical protein
MARLMDDDGDVMSDEAMPFGMAVSLCNSLDRDGILESWPARDTAILGRGTQWSLNVVRDIAIAEVMSLEADDRRERKNALSRQRAAHAEANRLIGTFCMSNETVPGILTSIGLAAAALSEALVARHSRFSGGSPDLRMAAAAAESAMEDAEAIDAWPTGAVAKALLRMVEATAGKIG